MCTVSVRRFVPFFATNGCRRLFTSTRPTSGPRRHDTIRAVTQGERRYARKSRDLTIQPGSKGFLRRRGDEGDVDDLRTLKGLLYPGTEPVVAKYIPLEAAAKIVATLQSIPTGLSTPREVTTKVLKIARCADRTFPPWPLVALHQIALALTRPGEASNSEHNGELIARLLHMAASDSAQPHYGPSLSALFGKMNNRAGGNPILFTDYSVDAREHYARFITDPDAPLSHIMLHRTTVLLRRELDPSKRDALFRSYVEVLEAAYNQQSDSRKRLMASASLAQAYAIGDSLLRDGQLAKLWWERTLCLGLKTVGINHVMSVRAAWNLGRHYLSKRGPQYNEEPLWAPDFTKGFRYLHLAKWGSSEVAHLLGSLYYLDHESDHCRTIKDHISFHGVIPDDTLAAEAFCIAAERYGERRSQYKLAYMLYQGRAHPPVDPTVVKKSAFTPRLPRLPQGTRLAPDDDWTSEELEKVLEHYNDASVVKLAPRSRRKTLDYAWKLVKPAAGDERMMALRAKLASLQELIRDERQQYQE